MAVYPSTVAAILKLCQNAFQTIPHISFVDAQNNCFQILVSTKSASKCIHSFWRSSDFWSINGRFLVKNHDPSFVDFLSVSLDGGVN